MEKHHIVIIVGILIVIGIWYMSKSANSLVNRVTASPTPSPNNFQPSTSELYGFGN